MRTASTRGSRAPGTETANPSGTPSVPRQPGQERAPRNDRRAKRLPKIALRNWRVRSKLLALIVIPTVAP